MVINHKTYDCGVKSMTDNKRKGTTDWAEIGREGQEDYLSGTAKDSNKCDDWPNGQREGQLDR